MNPINHKFIFTPHRVSYPLPKTIRYYRNNAMTMRYTFKDKSIEILLLSNKLARFPVSIRVSVK